MADRSRGLATAWLLSPYRKPRRIGPARSATRSRRRILARFTRKPRPHGKEHPDVRTQPQRAHRADPPPLRRLSGARAELRRAGEHHECGLSGHYPRGSKWHDAVHLLGGPTKYEHLHRGMRLRVASSERRELGRGRWSDDAAAWQHRAERRDHAAHLEWATA